ncbi:hypothetical protein, partial [Metapseudomonas otitidis]|uniref:hypothetical protein n=1 Tax=Metapseudomonas otitidis TaxID=319939 RepID=UPI001F1B0063
MEAVFLKCRNEKTPHGSAAFSLCNSASALHAIFKNSPKSLPPDQKPKAMAVAGAECNTVIELKPEHHAALPWN